MRALIPILASLAALQIPESVDVHIIAGQSNAQGPETGAPSDSSLINPNGFILGKEFLTNVEVNTFEKIKYPVNNLTLQTSVGHGIELWLAKTYYDNNQKACIIIKVVKGGTSLYVDWATGGELRNALISYINLAETLLAGHTITWKGFYWNQGEGDASNLTYANAYKTNFEGLIAEVKANTPIDDTTKIVTCRPHINGSDGVYLGTVRTAIETASIPNYSWFNVDDQTLVQPNDIHLDSDGQNVAAERYYNLVYP